MYIYEAPDIQGCSKWHQFKLSWWLTYEVGLLCDCHIQKGTTKRAGRFALCTVHKGHESHKLLHDNDFYLSLLMRGPIFNEQPNQSSTTSCSRDVQLYVCMCVCHTRKRHFPMD